KLDPVAARQVGDRKQLPFLPQDAVRERGNVRHVNARAHHAPAFAYGTQRQRSQITYGCENNRGVERPRRLVLRPASPFRTKRCCKSLRLHVALAGEGIDRASLPAGYLRDDVASRTKA